MRASFALWWVLATIFLPQVLAKELSIDDREISEEFVRNQILFGKGREKRAVEYGRRPLAHPNLKIQLMESAIGQDGNNTSGHHGGFGGFLKSILPGGDLGFALPFNRDLPGGAGGRLVAMAELEAGAGGEMVKQQVEGHPEMGTSPSLLRTVFVITPTFRRTTRVPNMITLANALEATRQKVHWVIIEDGKEKSPMLADLLNSYSFPHVYLALGHRPSHQGCRGRLPRNMGLAWVFNYTQSIGDTDGVIYFGDDDNSYHPRTFEELGRINRVGLMPVGLIGKYLLSTPITNIDQHANETAGLRRDSKIHALYDSFWNRKFAVDMAAIGLNLNFIKQINPSIDYWLWSRCNKFQMESQLLEKTLLKLADMDLLADDGTKILAWHTKYRVPRPRSITASDLNRAPRTNLEQLMSKLLMEGDYHLKAGQQKAP